MARPNRGSSGRDSKIYGKFSAVTFTTIGKNPGEISGTTFSIKGSGTTINKDGIQVDGGYILQHDTASEKSTAGIVNCAGTSLSRQTLGLSLIKHVVATPVFSKADVTACVITVNKCSTGAWASGVTEVDFYTYQAKDIPTAYGANVSISYFAIGT